MLNLPNLNFLEMLALVKLSILDLVILAIILLVLCFWLVSKLSEASLKKTLLKESDESLFTSPFKCVVFNAGDNSCKSALNYQTKPVLLSKAPELPLKGCDAKKCTCALLQHEDRRTGNDRRDMEVLDKRRKSTYANKRLVKDRRRASIKQFLLPKYRSFS